MGNSQTHKLSTSLCNSLQKEQSIVGVTVYIDGIYDDKCVVSAAYSKEETIGNILTTAIKYLEQKYSPMNFQITWLGEKSFTPNEASDLCSGSSPGFNDLLQTSITCYNTYDIWWKGLYITVKAIYQHKTITVQIDCEHMIKKHSTDPLQCPIYYKMKQKYELNQQYLNHLNHFNHFKNEWTEKPECKHADKCYSYVRLDEGGNTLSDLCHIKLYRHPPRSRTIELASNVHSLLINRHSDKNEDIKDPDSVNDMELYYLENEVIENGFKHDLCLQCKKGDDCKHNVKHYKPDEYSILNIVDKKLNSRRHKLMGSPLTRPYMLALVLYTGCDCNYDLCASQRNGDYAKWKYFDYCLYTAIKRLSWHEKGSFSVFSGLNKVKLNSRSVKTGYFVTYVSTSWNKYVAESFMDGEGMVIEIDPSFKSNKWVNCCDVSWISKFPDECEILFSRNKHSLGAFECNILDDVNDIQTVRLSKTPIDIQTVHFGN